MHRRLRGRLRRLGGAVARSRAARGDEDAEILSAAEAYYRRRLTAPAQTEQLAWEPVKIGPTWQQDGGHWVDRKSVV